MDLKLDIEPAPAARPRVSRKGWTYYPAKYKNFKAALAAMFINAINPKFSAFAKCVQPCVAHVEIVASRPKTTKLPFPKPDVDNYFKAVTDAATGSVWADDWQIQKASVEKRWAKKGETPHVRLQVKWNGIDN